MDEKNEEKKPSGLAKKYGGLAKYVRGSGLRENLLYGFAACLPLKLFFF